MTSPILITGGTGSLGSRLVPLLASAGRRVRVLSRGEHADAGPVEYVRGDLETGEGLAEAVLGIETVVHGAGSAKRDALKARNLLHALAAEATATHIVYISVVGADTTPVRSAMDRAALGYFEQKHLAERAIVESGIPWSVLRATQFHEFFAALGDLGDRMPVVPSFAGFRYQPVDARDVAERLRDLALGAPTLSVEEIGGPRVYPMEELLRGYLRARGLRRPVIPLHIAGAAARAQRAGANLTPDHATGSGTWEEYLGRIG